MCLVSLSFLSSTFYFAVRNDTNMGTNLYLLLIVPHGQVSYLTLRSASLVYGDSIGDCLPSLLRSEDDFMCYCFVRYAITKYIELNNKEIKL